MSTTFNKSKPFISKIKERALLTKVGSSKETYHLVLDLENSGIAFNPGDSVAIFAQNDPRLVAHILKAMERQGDEEIEDTRSGGKLSLSHFLTHKANLARLTSSFLKLFHEEGINHLFQPENRTLLTQYLTSHHPLDLFQELGTKNVSLQEICNQFSPLLPRFYSIASSPLAYPREVHLTVALYTFDHKGERRYGVASHFLSHIAEAEKTPIPLYVQPSHAFFLPENPHADLIMIGPGTGVAPYRAFLQHRMNMGSRGKNWLFFGERNRATDYLYGDYWEAQASQGNLKLDLAFSRDQMEKIYVQHRMHAQAKELWTWLQEGAYFYVCGDAEYMAKDVEATLLLICQQEGKLTLEEAKAYLKSLRKQKRYLQDVY